MTTLALTPSQMSMGENNVRLSSHLIVRCAAIVGVLKTASNIVIYLGGGRRLLHTIEGAPASSRVLGYSGIAAQCDIFISYATEQDSRLID